LSGEEKFFSRQNLIPALPYQTAPYQTSPQLTTPSSATPEHTPSHRVRTHQTISLSAMHGGTARTSLPASATFHTEPTSPRPN